MKLFKFLTEEFTAGAIPYEDRESYYKQFVESFQYSYYRDMAADSPSQTVFLTEHPIKMFGIEFNAEPAVITKNLGRPRLQSFYQQQGYKTDISFFKRDFGSYNAVIQTHSVNNQFAYGAISVLRKEDHVMHILKQILSTKYHVNLHDTDLKYVKIKDREDNAIIFRNVFYPTLIYITGDLKDLLPEINSEMDSAANSITNKTMKDWSKWL